MICPEFNEAAILALRRRYPTETARSISESIGISLQTVQRMVWHLQLSKDKSRKTQNGLLTVSGKNSIHKMKR